MRYLVAVGLTVIVACAGAAGLVSGAKSQLEGVARVDVVVAELAPPSDGFENYLLVGTDSREGVDPSDPDYATMGDDLGSCLLYTSPSPRDRQKSRMPSSA